MKTLLPFIIVLTAALAGCATSPTGSRDETRAVAADDAGRVLRIEGESVLLGEAAAPMSPAVFVSRIRQLTSSGRDEDAGQLVRMYPDLAEQAIFSSRGDTPALKTIAAWMDGFASPDRGGWSSLVADRADNPRRYSAWDTQRASAWTALRRGAFAQVADLKLTPPTDGPTPWLEVDATLLRATATLVAGRPGDAAKLFAHAADFAAGWDARVAARAHLLASLSHQLGGNTSAAAQSHAAATRIVSIASIHDPMTLRLLLKTHGSDGNSTDAPSRREIRARLGRVELQRGSPQAALLAWRAAEDEPGNEPTLNRLRIGQAESLMALGQDEPAIAMLIGLARTEVRAEALVMLGLVQLRRGQVDLALAVLREAVDATNAQSHPNVYADAGLALLSTGSRKTGLSLLHEARDVYQARGDTNALRQLLTNELQYARAVDDSDLANQARQMLLEVNR